MSDERRSEHDDALEVTKRRFYRRLARLENQYERASAQAEDRARSIAQLRAALERYQRQPMIRLARAARARIRSALAAIRPRHPQAAPPAAPPGSAVANYGSRRLATIAIHIAAPNEAIGATWGDTPFAEALRKGFEARGWVAAVHTQDAWETPAAVAADVALHLFGVRVPPVRPGQVSLLWVISHPDLLTARRCETYDAVFVASDSFRDQLAERIATPVYTLHQATDPDQFYPDPTGPHHELLFVGGSRRDRRPIVDAAARTERDLAVYGGNWTPDLLAPHYLRGSWIPNDELHRYYASADIVLNDHWLDMREEGFISNRVYDALASGAFVLSDHVSGMDEAFDGSVATYQRDDELAAIIEDTLAHPDERRARVQRGRAAVLGRHTFAHRVAAIIAALDGLPAGRAIARRTDPRQGDGAAR